MNKVKTEKSDYYIQKFNFESSGSYFPSNKYTQGIDRKFTIDIKQMENVDVVYMFVDPKTKDVLKFGDTENCLSRLNKEYISVTNTTNNKVRSHIKEIGGCDIYIKTLKTVIIDEGFGPVKVSAHSKVEKSLLNHFKNLNGRLPILNSQQK